MLSGRCLLLMLFTALVLGTLSEAAKGKTAEKSSTTSSPPKEQAAAMMFTDLVDFSKLEVVDLLRSGAVLVGLIFAFLADKKGESRVWQLTESIFIGGYGLACYFFPSLMLGYRVVGKLDNLHIYLAQGIGASFVGLAVVSHRQYHANSKDSQVTGGWLLSRAVGFTFMMIPAIHDKVALAKETPRFADQAVSFAGMAYGLLWIGSLVKLWQFHSCGHGGGRSSSRGQAPSVLNQHLLVTIMIMLPFVIMEYGMPEFVMESMGVTGLKLDKIHFSLVKGIAGIGLTSILQMLTALQYESDGDKRTFFIGNLVIMAMMLPLMFLNQYKYSLYPQKIFVSALVAMALQAGNSACAAFIRMKDKKY